MNKFNRIAGYKINIQKLAVFLYTNKTYLEKNPKTYLEKNPIHSSIKNEVFWNKFRSEGERSVH